METDEVSNDYIQVVGKGAPTLFPDMDLTPWKGKWCMLLLFYSNWCLLKFSYSPAWNTFLLHDLFQYWLVVQINIYVND